MASIPNLNTLRAGRGGPRLRGRRGGHATSGHDALVSLEDAQANDKIVQQTDHDASSSRLSAIELGYLKDEYAPEIAQPGEQPPRRYPIINRGTYVRTTAIDRLVSRFLHAETPGPKQIVSLGAGSDTRFFRLCGQHGTGHVVYHELDFEHNVTAKRAALERSPLLSERLKAAKAAGSSYHLHAIDLRTLASASDADTLIPDLDPALPTLILSECCLCYLPPDEATAVLTRLLRALSGAAAVVVYEPVRPFDPFGRTMVSNLASRGIHLQTLRRYASLEAQRRRFRAAGLDGGQGARDVRRIWEGEAWVSGPERERVERLEWLDEMEEWELLASHYCVAWGFKGELFGRAWSEIEGGRMPEEDLDED